MLHVGVDAGIRRRTGGRSARVRSAVHRAVSDLLVASSPESITVAQVAVLAGVNPTSIYRRWGTLQALIVEVEAERLRVNSPIPNTGTLRGDLLAYARNATKDITRPGGLALLRAVMATSELRSPDASAPHLGGRRSTAGQEEPVARAPLRARGDQIQAMLERARQRGEMQLHYTDVLDGILAPIYLRTLLGIGGLDQGRLVVFVDHTLGRLPDGADVDNERSVMPHSQATSRQQDRL